MKKTGNAQQWACDVVTDAFDQDFLDQLRILTNNDILLVPRRLKGITSGQNGRCYWNANICAQTWGGKVWYGWSIYTTEDGGIELYGHACWLTPENKLVDPTYFSDNNTYFVPYSDKLIINGRVTESMCDFRYPKSAKDINSFLNYAANIHGDFFDDDESHGYYSGIGIDHERYLNKIVYCDALPQSFVSMIMNDLDCQYQEEAPSYQEKAHLMLSPCVKPIKEGVPKKLTSNPNLTLEIMCKRFNIEQKPICYLYAGHNLTAQYGSNDMVWDSKTVKNPTLVNMSLKTGKLIQDIAPLQEIIDKHSLPTQKKRLQKVMATSEQYNLSPQEVVMLSNPFLFPHPHLVSKAGWKSIPRIKTVDLIAN